MIGLSESNEEGRAIDAMDGNMRLRQCLSVLGLVDLTLAKLYDDHDPGKRR